MVSAVQKKGSSPPIIDRTGAVTRWVIASAGVRGVANATICGPSTLEWMSLLASSSAMISGFDVRGLW